jgi:FkbM family methyltransferase
MGLRETLKAHQDVARVLPKSWQLPLRYQAQRMLGMLEPEMALLPVLVQGGELCLDVGANRGVYTYRLAQLCHRVIAFEPQPDCIEVISAWSPPHVEVQQVALSDRNGVLPFYVPIEHGRLVTTRASVNRPEGLYREIEVPIRRLDDYGFADVRFIKIDVEGHELAVLRGAERTLTTCLPNLLVEVDYRNHEPSAWQTLLNLLRGYGYAPHCVHDGVLQPIHEDPRALAEERDLVNFLFLPNRG